MGWKREPKVGSSQVCPTCRLGGTEYSGNTRVPKLRGRGESINEARDIIAWEDCNDCNGTGWINGQTQ